MSQKQHIWITFVLKTCNLHRPVPIAWIWYQHSEITEAVWLSIQHRLICLHHTEDDLSQPLKIIWISSLTITIITNLCSGIVCIQIWVLHLPIFVKEKGGGKGKKRKSQTWLITCLEIGTSPGDLLKAIKYVCQHDLYHPMDKIGFRIHPQSAKLPLSRYSEI